MATVVTVDYIDPKNNQAQKFTLGFNSKHQRDQVIKLLYWAIINGVDISFYPSVMTESRPKEPEGFNSLVQQINNI